MCAPLVPNMHCKSVPDMRKIPSPPCLVPALPCQLALQRGAQGIPHSHSSKPTPKPPILSSDPSPCRDQQELQLLPALPLTFLEQTSTSYNALPVDINAPSPPCKKEKHLEDHKVPFGQNTPSDQRTLPCAADHGCSSTPVRIKARGSLWDTSSTTYSWNEQTNPKCIFCMQAGIVAKAWLGCRHSGAVHTPTPSSALLKTESACEK